jgi:hypothetical protein
VRLIVYFYSPYVYIYIYGTHVHHFTWGIILLTIAGFAALYINKPKWRPLVASLYGIGLALAFDEIGMWLFLDSNYWMRISYDVMITITFMLVNTVYFGGFWIYLARRIFLRRKKLGASDNANDSADENSDGGGQP